MPLFKLRPWRGPLRRRYHVQDAPELLEAHFGSVAGVVGDAASAAGKRGAVDSVVIAVGVAASAAGQHGATATVAGKVGAAAQATAAGQRTGTQLGALGDKASVVGAEGDRYSVAGASGVAGNIVGKAGQRASQTGAVGAVAAAQAKAGRLSTTVARLGVAGAAQGAHLETHSGSVAGSGGLSGSAAGTARITVGMVGPRRSAKRTAPRRWNRYLGAVSGALGVSGSAKGYAVLAPVVFVEPEVVDTAQLRRELAALLAQALRTENLEPPQPETPPLPLVEEPPTTPALSGSAAALASSVLARIGAAAKRSGDALQPLGLQGSVAGVRREREELSGAVHGAHAVLGSVLSTARTLRLTEPEENEDDLIVALAVLLGEGDDDDD